MEVISEVYILTKKYEISNLTLINFINLITINFINLFQRVTGEWCIIIINIFKLLKYNIECRLWKTIRFRF